MPKQIRINPPENVKVKTIKQIQITLPDDLIGNWCFNTITSYWHIQTQMLEYCKGLSKNRIGPYQHFIHRNIYIEKKKNIGKSYADKHKKKQEF